MYTEGEVRVGEEVVVGRPKTGVCTPILLSEGTTRSERVTRGGTVRTSGIGVVNAPLLGSLIRPLRLQQLLSHDCSW